MKMRKLCWFVAIAGGLASVLFSFCNWMDNAIWSVLMSLLFIEFAKMIKEVE